MKRTQDTQELNETKKPKLNQAYSDMYSQYNMLSQCTGGNNFGQPFANYQPSMYMNYGTNMMAATHYGYPGFFNPNGYAEANRTIYLGGIPDETPASEVLKQVKTGAIESYRKLSEKRCAFLSFVDAGAAHAFYQELSCKRLTVNQHEIKHGWGNSTPMNMGLKAKIQAGATRAVYFGKLEPEFTKEELIQHISKYGDYEEVKMVPDKGCAFVHFLTINSATKCVADMAMLPEWQSKRINYAKDHCANHHQAEFAPPATASGFSFDPYVHPVMNMQVQPSAGNILRTIYIGNLQPEVKYEDICNAIRGGNVLQVRYFAEKRIAFVSFMDASTAISVFNFANTQGLVIKGRKVKVGWGKPSPIPGPLVQAIQQGATRNVYIGGINESVTEEKLRQDFEHFGEIELVNLYREKNCAFVNFTSVNNAVTAVTGIKGGNPDYMNFRVNYGKDRCGHPPRVRNHDAEVKKEPEESA